MGLPFEITPIERPISRAGEGLTLAWSPVDPEAQVEVSLEGDCLIQESRTLGGDTGQLSFAPGELRAWKNKAAQKC